MLYEVITVEELHQLFDALRRYEASGGKALVIAPYKTLLFPFPKPELLQAQILEFGATIKLAAFKDQMLHRITSYNVCYTKLLRSVI